jgi:hypothetical protein
VLGARILAVDHQNESRRRGFRAAAVLSWLWRRSSAYGVDVAEARTDTGKVAVRQPAQCLAGDAAFITFGEGATFVPAILRDLVTGVPDAARMAIADLR